MSRVAASGHRGRTYATAGRDRHNLCFAEVGRGDEIQFSDGTSTVVTNGYSRTCRVTFGWSVPFRVRREGTDLDVSWGPMWVEMSGVPSVRKFAGRVTRWFHRRRGNGE
jgi:hypothetical protein